MSGLQASTQAAHAYALLVSTIYTPLVQCNVMCEVDNTVTMTTVAFRRTAVLLVMYMYYRNTSISHEASSVSSVVTGDNPLELVPHRK